MTAPPSAPPSSAIFRDTPTEFVAVVLAATAGARLFPLTSSAAGGAAKHLLPIGGPVPCIVRLIHSLLKVGFVECVLALAGDDNETVLALKVHFDNNNGIAEGSSKAPHHHPVYRIGANGKLKVTVVKVEDSQGSLDALRKIELAQVIDPMSHIVVLPGDMVVLQASALSDLVHTHRQHTGILPSGVRDQMAYKNSHPLLSACTVLLTDVGEVDEHGHRLKESAKQKMGGLARLEEDIEYIALSYSEVPGIAPRIIWKQAKLDVERDNDTSATTKLKLPKSRVRSTTCAGPPGQVAVRIDWSDVHAYVFHPWVRKLIVHRKSLVSVQGDLLPLLISRQFMGILKTFGSKAVDADATNERKELVQDLSRLLATPGCCNSESPFISSALLAAGKFSNSSPQADSGAGTLVSSDLGKVDGVSILSSNTEYAVTAVVKQPVLLRAHSVPYYLHANKEFCNQVASATNVGSDFLFLAPGYVVKNKFSTILEADVTDVKINYKSAVLGRRCKVGKGCRLNNVVIMDDVVLGDNVILQNSIVGSHAVIGDNCNLNDCQVGTGYSVAPGTKEKSESFADL